MRGLSTILQSMCWSSTSKTLHLRRSLSHLGVGEVGEENALGEKEDITVVEETRFGSVSETDVSPVVHQVTKIVRAENGLVSMEERLDELGFQLDSEIVDKVLKSCFKVLHLALRFFDWVKLKEGFCHTTKTYNTLLCIAGEAREFGLVEKLVEEMERNSCEKDVKTWSTILIQMYGKAKSVGRALLVYEKMKKCGFEPDSVVFRMISGFSVCLLIALLFDVIRN